MADLDEMAFASSDDWEGWLERHHADSPGLWVKIAKKGSGVETVSYPQVVELALCFGWIDGQRQKVDDVYFRQRLTPRAPRSKWSKINCDKAEALIASGRMQPNGLQEVERAKADGRWDAAYDGQRTMEVPDDLALALRRNSRARKAFDGLDSRNRYAVLFRIHDAKRPETRARRIEQFVTMLAEGRTLH